MIQSKLSGILKKRGKALYWLSQETGIAYSTLHKINASRSDGVKYRVLDSICAALDCQPGDLLERVPDGALKPEIRDTAEPFCSTCDATHWTNHRENCANLLAVRKNAEGLAAARNAPLVEHKVDRPPKTEKKGARRK